VSFFKNFREIEDAMCVNMPKTVIFVFLKFKPSYLSGVLLFLNKSLQKCGKLLSLQLCKILTASVKRFSKYSTFA